MTKRITYNPQQCGGKPCIRGMRIRVADILELYAASPVGSVDLRVISLKRSLTWLAS